MPFHVIIYLIFNVGFQTISGIELILTTTAPRDVTGLISELISNAEQTRVCFACLAREIRFEVSRQSI